MKLFQRVGSHIYLALCGLLMLTFAHCACAGTLTNVSILSSNSVVNQNTQMTIHYRTATDSTGNDYFLSLQFPAQFLMGSGANYESCTNDITVTANGATVSGGFNCYLNFAGSSGLFTIVNWGNSIPAGTDIEIIIPPSKVKNPTSAGVYSVSRFAYVGSDGMTVIDSAASPLPSFTVVSSAITPASQSVQGVVGTAITPTSAYTLNNLTSPTFSVSPALPAGLALNVSTGAISGTPTVALVSSSYTVTASDGTSSASATVTIVVQGASGNGRAAITDAVDSTVTGTLLAQASAAQRFSEVQISNVTSHLQRLKKTFSVRQNTFSLGLNAPGMAPIRQMATVIDSELKQQQLAAGVAPVPSSEHTGLVQARADRATPSPESLAMKSPDTNGANINDLLLNRSDMGIWATGTLEYGSLRKNEFKTSGVTTGIDFQLSPNLIAGVSAGFGSDITDIDASGTRVISQQATVIGYGLYRVEDDWILDALVGYGDLKFSNSRYSRAAASVFKANRDGSTLFGSVGLGKIVKTSFLDMQPYARITHMTSTLDSYDEGANTNALAYDKAGIVSRAYSAGVVVSHDLLLVAGKLTPSAKFELKKNIRGTLHQTISYADTPSESMVYSATTAPNFVQSIGLGLTYVSVRGLVCELGWFGSIGSNSYHSNSVRFSANLQF